MFLGLDLGTSGLRALLVRADGEVVATAQSGYGATHPHPGWSEQNPADWIIACRKCLADLRARQADAFAAVKGIGIAGQMHGATLLDDNGRVLRPAILWNDTRSHEQAARLDLLAEFRAITGNIVFPGFTAPKLAWLAEHQPDIFKRVHKVLLPKDYLSFWLTGDYVSDLSDSAGTAWLDVGARRWSDRLLAGSGMQRRQMPRLVEGNEIAGTLRLERALDLGLPMGVAVVGGAGDNAAAACGVGALNAGDGFVSLGTSGVLLSAREEFAPNAASAVHCFCHAVPGRWIEMAVTLAATDCLDWLAANLGRGAVELSDALGHHISGPGTQRFLPYLSGERTPHNDSAIRGAFLGLGIATESQDLTQAVMEGVTFALRDGLETLRKSGARFTRLLGIGGGMASNYWAELVATTLDLPIDLPETGEFGAALGAARLAICGVTGATPQAVMQRPKLRATIEPRHRLIPAYAAAYQKFHATYPIIKALQ